MQHSKTATHHIICIVGARPNFMKIAPIMVALNDFSPALKVTLVHTGQHYDVAMNEQYFQALGIPSPDINLEVGSGSHAVQTAEVMCRFEAALEGKNPTAILVVGDVNSTIACALVATKKGIPVIHVEAGLRTGNLHSPWPEEANRKLTGALARFHFAPTDFAADNLRREGVDPTTIVMTGNTVIDTLHLAIEKIDAKPSISAKTLNDMPFLAKSGRKILVTGHRRENFGKPFENICNALRTIASDWPGVDIIYPMHLNPNVREPVLRLLSDKPNIHLLQPLEYLSFIDVMRRVDLIVTDSGGLQEEGAALRKPVLVMRDTTERGEAVATGAVRLIGTAEDSITEGIKTLLQNPDQLASMQNAKNPFGDGTATQKIVRFIQTNLQL